MVSNRFMVENSINESGQQFFMLLWLELFNKLTIDTYRFRTMNTKAVLIELKQVFDYVEKGIWDSVNISLVAKEAMKLIEHDKIISNYTYYGGLKHKIGEAIKTSRGDENLKAMVSGVVANLGKNYFQQLVTGLKKVIDNNDYECIEWYTKTLATELVNLGYDRGFLEFAVHKVFFGNNNRSFDEKFFEFVEYIEPVKNEYEVILKLYPSSPKIFPKPILNFIFMNKFEFKSEEKDVQKYLTSGDPKIFAITTIKGIDSFSAAINARSQLGNVLDIIQYVFQDVKGIEIDDDALVRKGETGLLCSSRPTLVGHLPSSLHWLPKIEGQMSKILESPYVTFSSKDKLRGALRYFRLSREAISIEHQFLNLWIALEHLVRTGAKHRSIIEPITTFVPKTLALNYLNKIIRDAIELIKRNKIILPTEVQQHLDKHSPDKFILLTRNQGLFDQILSCGLNQHLIQRLKRLQIILSNSNNIRQFVEKNRNDIDLQLARMYRHRNQIVHHAAHDINIAGLTANLLSYLRDIINKVLYELSTDQTMSDLHEVFMKYKVTYDQYVHALEMDRNNAMAPLILVKPLKLLWP